MNDSLVNGFTIPNKLDYNGKNTQQKYRVNFLIRMSFAAICSNKDKEHSNLIFVAFIFSLGCNSISANNNKST